MALRGTVGIAGHRTTYGAPFRRIDRPRPGDPIVVVMPYATFAYRVERTRAVVPKEVWVKRRVSYDRLIVSASHPPVPQNRFRWTVSARSARLLAVREQGGRRTADLALLDHGFPIWYRLAIDLDTGRTVRARLVTPANLIEDRYSAFNRPVDIEPPKGPVQSPLVP